MKPPVKQSWLERAVQTYNYHSSQLRNRDTWTLTDTADALGRSLGSVSEDVTIASWLKTHERQIRAFKYAREAIAFIRDKKKKINGEPIHLG